MASSLSSSPRRVPRSSAPLSTPCEGFSRLAFGAQDVAEAVQALQARGVAFEDNEFVAPSERGALTVPLLPGVAFELVHSQPVDRR